jgi:DNA-binding NtrC family response regulator
LFRLYLPPLRERGEDVLCLAETLLEGLCRRHRASKREISPVGRQRLLAYPWPGNVRELAHELERAIVFETGGSLQFDHLTGSERTQAMPAGQPEDWFNERFVIPANGFSVEEAVMRIIHHALKQSGENMSAAARLLGVPRDYLRYRLERKQRDEPSA